MMKTLRAKYQPLATAPAVLENELKALQEERNFHNRQVMRGNKEKVMAFNAEDEQNRTVQRLRTTPMGNALEEITEEEYNAASTEDKMRYHNRRKAAGEGHFHDAFKRRLLNNPNYIPPYNPKDSDIGKYPNQHRMVSETKEEYENMDDTEKMKYHSKMEARYWREGNRQLSYFHKKMKRRLKLKVDEVKRIYNKKIKPTYYSPEDEQNGN